MVVSAIFFWLRVTGPVAPYFSVRAYTYSYRQAANEKCMSPTKERWSSRAARPGYLEGISTIVAHSPLLSDKGKALILSEFI